MSHVCGEEGVVIKEGLNSMVEACMVVYVGLAWTGTDECEEGLLRCLYSFLFVMSPGTRGSGRPALTGGPMVETTGVWRLRAGLQGSLSRLSMQCGQ